MSTAEANHRNHAKSGKGTPPCLLEDDEADDDDDYDGSNDDEEDDDDGVTGDGDGYDGGAGDGDDDEDDSDGDRDVVEGDDDHDDDDAAGDDGSMFVNRRCLQSCCLCVHFCEYTVTAVNSICTGCFIAPVGHTFLSWTRI